MTPDGPVYILLHVDDMLVLSCHDKYWDELKSYFKANLRGITAQEEPVIFFVALLIHQHADHISVDRRGYKDKLHSKRDPADIPRAKVLYPLLLLVGAGVGAGVILPLNLHLRVPPGTVVASYAIHPGSTLTSAASSTL